LEPRNISRPARKCKRVCQRSTGCQIGCMAHSFLGFLNNFRYDAGMRTMSFCVLLTLSALAAACGEGGSSMDAAPPSDAPVTFDGASGVADAAPADAALTDATLA